MSLTEKILSFIFPNCCRVCLQSLKTSHPICPDCLGNIKWTCPPFCTQCGMPFEATTPLSHPCFHCTRNPPAFDWHRSCAVYIDPVSTLLHSYKYFSKLDLTKLFAQWLSDQHRDALHHADLLIPVPLATGRLRERTYNQSLELARGTSKLTGITVLDHALVKVRESHPQTGLKRDQRIENLRGAFQWREKKIRLKGKKVILIDDVYTTGSTLSACASELRKQKPQEIGALTIAINCGRAN